MGIPLSGSTAEYMERHSVSRLIARPPARLAMTGRLLTDAIDQNPHCVLPARRDRKGAPDCSTSVAGDGPWPRPIITGKTVDFRNVILIMTTNAGASDMARESIGFGQFTREDGRKRR